MSQIWSFLHKESHDDSEYYQAKGINGTYTNIDMI